MVNIIWSELCHQIEKSIVDGQLEAARSLLESQRLKNVPRDWATKFGELAFRVQRPLFALKVLQRFIEPENSFAIPATDKEKLVYASALFKLGAINDSHKILDSVNPENEHEALFAKSGALFYDWNYADGIPLLQAYLKSAKISDYRRLVAQVNLAAAFIIERQWDKASDLLESVIPLARQNSHALLEGNCYELQGQFCLYQGRFNEALTWLEKSLVILKNESGLFSMMAEKWIIFCRARLASSPENLELEISNLRRLRIKAQDLRHWNTIRECDLLESMLTKNEDLLKRVIMGTPSEIYRRRARQLFQSSTSFISKGEYRLRLNGDASPIAEVPEFDPYRAPRGAGALIDKPMLLALYDGLTQDFYQPCTLGIIFERLYPDEKFNPFTSPSRVLRLLKRLDEWFVENQSPLRVELKKSEFRIVAQSDCWILVRRGSQLSPLQGQFQEIKNRFHGRHFSVALVAEALGISESSSRNILKKAYEKGQLSRIGRGRSTSYFLKSRAVKKGAA